MRTIIKVFAAVEILAFLGVAGMMVAKHHTTTTNHAPVSRLPMPPMEPKVIERAKSWTVLISNEGFEDRYRGTGMMIDSTHVLTADHMVSTNKNEMWIYVFPGRKVVKGKAVLEDPKDDLAILEIDEKVELSAYATFQDAHHDGEPIIIIGNILGGMQWYVSYGIISGEWGKYLLMDGTMTHGDSGGPWINAQGEVVGLSDWQMGDEEPESSIKGGVSAKTIQKFLKRREKHVKTSQTDVYTARKSDNTRRMPI